MTLISLINDYVYRLAFEVIMGAIIIFCIILELILAFFAAIDFRSLEKAQ